MSADVPEVTASEGARLVQEGALLLDVRETDEWQAGHAPDARHLPMREVPARIGEIPNDRRIVTICRSGGRSRAVAEALLGAGYDVVNVAGGMHAWEAADLAVETDEGVPGAVV
jgi:rhodanese-related sulfurtransferase